MKKMFSTKGFTLIELLIVIAIIAVLAVAFLPTLLNAPAKGRDTARINTIGKIRDVVMARTLLGKPYPNTAGPIIPSLTWKQLVDKDADNWGLLAPDFGGKLPEEPQKKSYYLVLGTGLPAGGYSFGIWAEVENLSSGNANCTLASPYTIALGAAAAPSPAAPAVATVVPCYALLAQ